MLLINVYKATSTNGEIHFGIETSTNRRTLHDSIKCVAQIVEREAREHLRRESLSQVNINLFPLSQIIQNVDIQSNLRLKSCSELSTKEKEEFYKYLETTQ